MLNVFFCKCDNSLKTILHIIKIGQIKIQCEALLLIHHFLGLNKYVIPIVPSCVSNFEMKYIFGIGKL